jgi:tetratricopeptide (TPR) repeat protein
VYKRPGEPYALYLLGRKAEAVQRARKVLELFPWYWYGYFIGAAVLAGGGYVGEAIAAVEKGLTIDPGNACLLAVRAVIHGSSGEPDEARRILRQLEQMARMRYISPAALAIASKACGEIDRYYEWLHNAIDERDVLTAIGLIGRPIPGHGNDPRYVALRSKMNLAPPKRA